MTATNQPLKLSLPKMTRINVGIDPAELPRQQLMAEHREIKRIPNAIAAGRFNLTGQPAQFKLGTGHVKFFYTRLAYLLERYYRIHAECRRRGYDVANYAGAWAACPEELFGEYTPTQRDRDLLLARFAERGIETLTPEKPNA